MGGKGTGGMMAKGLDKLVPGGALTGNLSQTDCSIRQLSTILADTTLRNKFMMLVKQAEAGAKNNPHNNKQLHKVWMLKKWLHLVQCRCNSNCGKTRHCLCGK